jgi:hypothetical protein
MGEQNKTQEEEEKARTVYVSELSDDLSQDQLLQFMSCLGRVVAMWPVQDRNQHKRCYKIVYSNVEEVKQATDVNGTVLLGKPIRIMSANEYESSSNRTEQQSKTTIDTKNVMSSSSPSATYILQNASQTTGINNTAAATRVSPIMGYYPNIHSPGSIIYVPNWSTSPGTIMVTPPSHGYMAATVPPVNMVSGSVLPPNFPVPNPYIKPVPNVPFTPIFSTGDDLKDREIARTIYIGNVNSRVTPADLVDFFSVCGPVAYIRMAGDESQPTRFAFIEFLDIDAAHRAMAMSGKILMDRPIKINRSKNTIVKPPVNLTREEQRQLDYALHKLAQKLQKYAKKRSATDSSPKEEPEKKVHDVDDRSRHKRKSYASSASNSGGGGGGGKSSDDDNKEDRDGYERKRRKHNEGTKHNGSSPMKEKGKSVDERAATSS